MNSQISIGMPVYNCQSTVGEAIASILNQTFKDWELIVYDDGSKDHTVAASRRFSDPRIRVVEGGRNVGLPTCLNEIIAHCGSTFFARMDGDDIAYPMRLQKQFDFMQAHPEVDVVGGSMMVFGSVGAAMGVRRGVLEHAQICTRPWSGISLAHPTWMGKTEWFQRHPYRADAVRTEDWELLTRAYRESTFANVPQVVLGYREESLSLRKILVARRNKCRIMLQRAWEERAPWRGFRGLTGQIVRSLVDVAAIGTRLNYRLLKHRVPPFSFDERVEWEGVLDKTRAKVMEKIRQGEAVSQ
jgi:glycosyltransferase involved in cell wall biosynthesis